MNSLFSQIVVVIILIVFPFQIDLLADTQPTSPTAETINQILKRLQSKESPDNIFSFPVSKTPDHEVRVIWLDPRKWIQKGDTQKLGRYIGLWTFVRMNAPFHRVQQTLIAYRESPKFTPGLISTDVVDWKRISPEKSIVLINRRRELPALLVGLKDANYQAQNEIVSDNQTFLTVRSSLVLKNGKVGMRDVMQEMEGFEYLLKISDEKTLYIGGLLTLPNTGIIPARSSGGHAQDSGRKNLLLNGIGLVKSKLEVLDVRERFFDIISTSVLEDAFKTTAAMVQVTTDPRWREKRTYQLTSEDTQAIFRENNQLFRKAKKNGWVTFPS